MCGGYFLTKVNTNEERIYVSKIDISGISGNVSLPDFDDQKDIILGGYLVNGEPKFKHLKVVEYTRSIPLKDNSVDSTSSKIRYYGLEESKPTPGSKTDCLKYTLVELNTGAVSYINSYKDQYRGTISALDTQWLDYTITGTALVSGVVNNKVLNIDRVFVQLPDPETKCPELPLAKCLAGFSTVYSRDEKRCLVFEGCAKPGVCTLGIPVCDPGYNLTSFPSKPNVCPQYYCDPAFVTDTNTLPH
eukprot:gene3066-3834_t